MSQAITNPTHHATAPRRRRRLGWLALLLLVLLPIAGGLAAVATGNVDAIRERALAISKPLLDLVVHQGHGGGVVESEAPAPALSYDPTQPWDGLLRVSPTQQKAIGTRIVPVKLQSEPLDLELQGKTDYNPDTLVKVRPRFDALVLAVHATVGQKVKKGDPLVELYSVRLAEAKLQFESKQSQAEHDHQIAEHQRDLASKGVIPDASRVLLDAVNAERQSQLEYKLARDELEVFGVPAEEIARLNEETGTDKAKMTLRAQADGTIVSRDVAVGNIYDEKDTLLTIASIEQLWVWGNVYERDLADVRAGLPWEVHFPFTREVVAGTVEYVSSQVDPQTHAVRIRGSIPNADGHFKSDQFVRVVVKCPPVPGSTTIPRIAVVTDSDESYVFIQRPDQPDAFERRQVSIAHEFSDHVIVEKGLAPGELVVTNGSLVMTQLYEDRRAIETGAGS